MKKVIRRTLENIKYYNENLIGVGGHNALRVTWLVTYSSVLYPYIKGKKNQL